MEIDAIFVGAIQGARQHLMANNVAFEPGLTDVELNRVEEQFGFRFPLDLRYFLTLGIPVGERFPNWRHPDHKLYDQIAWPLEGIYFDVRNGVFWYPEWGARPGSDDDAVSVAMQKCAGLPLMIPVFGHSYLPSIPCRPGNPVFSIYQADVIHRGGSLAEYLLWINHDETDEKEPPVFDPSYTEVEFWTEVARLNAT